MVPAGTRPPPRTGSENPPPGMRTRGGVRRPSALACATLLLFATLAAPRTVVAGDASLYTALGGQPGIEALADAYVDRLASAGSTRRSFAGSNLRRIKQHLAAQICELAGGPCHYDSDPMTVVHANLGISEAEFFAGVQSLRDLLRERGIPLGTTNRLLAKLAPMKRDIVDVRIAAATHESGPALAAAPALAPAPASRGSDAPAER